MLQIIEEEKFNIKTTSIFHVLHKLFTKTHDRLAYSVPDMTHHVHKSVT